jgi:hypothetical protein
MKSIAYQIHSTFVLLAFMLIIASCENLTDTDPKTDPGTDVIIDPAKASEYLKFSNAIKIEGDLPTAPDGKLKINVKDTIYIVHGFPFGDRIVVKHDGLQDISGFYVEVIDGTFYYDVPIISSESGDSTEVFYINMGFPDGGNWDFPYTIPVRIQPHGPDGSPLDEFVVDVTIEDNEEDGVDPCSPLTPAPTCFYDTDSIRNCTYPSGPYTWIWEFTVVENPSGDIYTAYAPFMFLNIPTFTHGGCCWNGFSTPAKYDPYCVPANPEYHEVTVDNAYYVRYFEFLDLYDNNTFERRMRDETSNYSPDSSNYCTGEAGYFVDPYYNREDGTHTFSEGNNYISFNRLHLLYPQNLKNNHSFWTPKNGEIFYTCNSLIISYSFNGDKWSDVYMRNRRPLGELEIHTPEFYE